MLEGVKWIYNGVNSNGELCDSVRKDRLSTKDIIVVPFDGSLLLASEYIYDIYYYDDNFNMINRYVIRKYHSKSIFLFKNEKIRIFVASSNDIELTQIRRFKFVPHVLYFNIDLLSVSNINFIGDSIVAGVGGSSYSPEGVPFIELSDDSKLSRKENIQGFCYVNLMRRRLKRDFNINVKNRGCSKYTSALISYGIRQLVSDDDELICLCIGTNDRLIKNDNINNYINRVLSIISYIEAIGKKVVILSPIPSAMESENVSYNLYQISCALKELTDKLGIPYINLFELLTNKLIKEKISLEDIFVDGLYPNDWGYYLIYLCFCEHIGINHDTDSFLNEINVPDVYEKKQVSLELHRSDVIQLSPLGLMESCRTDFEQKQKNIVKTSIGYLVLHDCSITVNTDCISKFFKIIITKSLFEDSILASSNSYELYERYSYLYFSNINNNIFCNLLFPHLFDKNYKSILLNDFVDTINEGIIMLPSNQLVVISNNMFDSNIGLTRSSVMWKFSLFWIDALISKYNKKPSRELLQIIETQLKYFLDWMNGNFEKVDFTNIPSGDHSTSVRTVVFVNYLSIKERTDIELANDIKIILCHQIDWMILKSKIIKNNHGLIMLQGILAVLSIIPQNYLYNKLCRHVENTILDIWNNNFDSEYVCKENTIGYFNFNIECFKEIIRYVKSNKLSISISALENSIPKAIDVLKQLIFQNSEVPPVGDSAVYKLRLDSINSNHWYKESNIVCLKNDLRYFYLKCGHNSSAHKHVDDSSFVLRYKDVDIVIDSGMYNYDRTSNIRIYVESAFGHNMCFPCSLEGVLSPAYVKDFYNCGQIDYFNEIDDTFVLGCSYSLTSGFTSKRKVIENGNSLFVIDEYDNPNCEDVVDRLCLSPKSIFITRVGDRFYFKNGIIYFSVTFLIENSDEIEISKGYSSNLEHEFDYNLVLQIKQKSKMHSQIKYVIDYWEDIDNRSVFFINSKLSSREVIITKNIVKELDIWGSCVSRDVFGSNNDVVKNYIARQSIISSLQKPANIFENELENSSKFKLSMIASDIDKSVYSKLSEEHSDWLLIDFIDERFPLLKLNSTYLTLSNELLESYSRVKEFEIIERKYDKGVLTFETVPLESYIQKFSEKIIKIYKDKIILHRVYLSDVYVNKDNEICYFDNNVIKNNQKINKYLSYYYENLEKYIPKIHMVQAIGFPACENHKWGLGPMHFIDEYYRNIMNQIQGIVENYSVK